MFEGLFESEISPLQTSDLNIPLETEGVPYYVIETELPAVFSTPYVQTEQTGGEFSSPVPMIESPDSFSETVPDAIQETFINPETEISLDPVTIDPVNVAPETEISLDPVTIDPMTVSAETEISLDPVTIDQVNEAPETEMSLDPVTIDTVTIAPQTEAVAQSNNEAIPSIIPDVKTRTKSYTFSAPESDYQNDSNDETVLNDIYSLLDKRLPETENNLRSSEETAQSETEDPALENFYNEISDIRKYESEQLELLAEIKDSNIIHSNNDYNFGIVTASLITAVLGALSIGYLFRNIK